MVVDTEVGQLLGRVALTPRRREPYTTPYEIIRIATEEDERIEDQHRELGREVRVEAEKLARDHRISQVRFIGCDVSLDESYIEVKYQSDGRPNLRPVREGLESRYGSRVALKRYTFIERSGRAGGCDTCGLPLCCSTWSGARSMGPVNPRLARQQGVTPNDKIIGCCGEVKCCMRYEHEVYKEFKQRAPFKNTTVRLGRREGKVVDYSMVRDAVFVRFEQQARPELIPLGRLARENPGVRPADPGEWGLQTGDGGGRG